MESCLLDEGLLNIKIHFRTNYTIHVNQTYDQFRIWINNCENNIVNKNFEKTLYTNILDCHTIYQMQIMMMIVNKSFKLSMS